jgi:type IV secretion system protein VirB2
MRITNLIKNSKQALVYKHANKNLTTAIEREQQAKSLVKFALVAGACMLALEPSLALAQTGAVENATDFEAAIQKLINWMTGTIAKSVAILATVVLGFMAMAGKLQMETAGKVILGLVLIFSAAQIVGLIVT